VITKRDIRRSIALAMALLLARPAEAVKFLGHQPARRPAPKRTLSAAETRFWSLIDRTVDTDKGRQFTLLQDALAELSPKQIEEFQAVLDTQMKRSYRWDLWGAAYVAMSGASNDGFEYFRLWLISRGHTAFTRALAHPDDLAGFAPDNPDEMEWEDLGRIASDTWSAKTGKAADEMPGIDANVYGEPAGEPWPEDGRELAARYPKLARRFHLGGR